MKTKKKNILFSTTRQWNPGDEFILLGCMNLLQEITDFNPIIYNKNPQIRYVIGWKRKLINKLFKSIFRFPLFSLFYDNSIKPESRGEWIDLVVFAGSPSWYGEPSRDLYDLIIKYKLPTIFLGIGLGEDIGIQRLKHYELEVLKNALAITVRDQKAYSLLKDYHPIFKPCPALYSSKETRAIKQAKRIGLIYATHIGPKDNRVSENVSSYISRLYQDLSQIDQFEFEIICHYIDEMAEAKREFKDLEIHYSFDSKDYLSIYQGFDFIIGSRVHGLGIAASMGIPGVMISHDVRSDTVKGFLSQIISTNDTIDHNRAIILKKIDLAAQQSEKLLEHKETNKNFLVKTLTKVIPTS